MPPRRTRSSSRRNTPVSPPKSAASSPSTNRATRQSVSSQRHEADSRQTSQPRQTKRDADMIEVASSSRGGSRMQAQLETVDEEVVHAELVDTDAAQDESARSQPDSSSASSLSVDEIQLLDRDSMITNLDSLYGEAKAVLALFQSRDVAKLKQVFQDLSNPASRLAKKLVALSDILYQTRSTYVANPSGIINLDTATQKMAGAEYGTPLVNESGRPDGVLQLANLATNLSTLSRRSWSEMDTTAASHILAEYHDSLDYDTTLGTARIDVIREMRTQLTLAYLRARMHEDNFDPDDVLGKVFLPDDSSEALEPHLAARMENIREYFTTVVDQPMDLDSLDREYPWPDFLMQVALWTQKIYAQLEAHLDGQGGVESIQQVLKARPMSIEHPVEAEEAIVDTRTPLQAISVSKPAVGGAQAGLLVDSAGPPQGHIQKRMAAARARKSRSVVNSPMGQQEAPPSAQPLREALLSSHVDGNEHAGIDDGDIANDPDPPVQDVPLSQSVQAAFAANKRQTRERNKENLRPTKHFNQRQEGAVRVEWGIDGDDPEPTTKKRTHSDGAVQDEDEDEDEDDFESDQRPRKILTRRRAEAKTRQAAHDSDAEYSDSPETSQQQEQADQPSPRLPLTIRSNQAPHSSATAPSTRRGGRMGSQGPSQPHPRTSTQPRERSPPRTSQEELPHSTQASEANRRAKSHAAQMRAHESRLRQKPAQTRTPWSVEEINRLIELVEEYNTSWKLILDMDAEHPDGALLQSRGQVGLKDKARNLKMDWLKAKMEMPVNFERVTLGPSKIEMLRRIGVPVGEPGW